MSETVRNYTGATGPLRRRGPVRPRRAVVRALLLLLTAVLTAYAFWSTRDHVPEGRFIPKEQGYIVCLRDILARRAEIGASNLWTALPESPVVNEVARAFRSDLGLPEWLLNNLIGQTSYLTGNRIAYAGDVLFITKMTRLGTLLSRFDQWTPWVQRDEAGGLGLRKLPQRSLYYAVRGRVLIVSSSRDSLIRSLTLLEADAAGEATLQTMFAEAGTQDVSGSLYFDLEDPAGNVLDSAQFAVQIDPEIIRVHCRGALRPGSSEHFGPLLSGASPQPLMVPPPGMVEISANLGKPVRDVFAGLGKAVPWPWLSEAQWQKWEQSSDGPVSGLGQMLTVLLGPTGPGLRLSWTGVDIHEMFPMPELVATADLRNTTAEALFGRLPTAPSGLPEWAAFPHYDAQTQRVYLPMIGGPTLEPTAAVYGKTLLLSSSRRVAESLLAQPPETHLLPQLGNLFVRIRPPEIVKSLVEVARLLVDMGMLPGYTPESFEAAASDWQQRAQHLDNITMVAAVQEGIVSAQLDLSLVASPPGAPPASVPKSLVSGTPSQ
ncbi:MAG: hypothetical protein HY706_16560 [Candidatus Hydrogenedentes bacterium]|nr:hypothetical protein [Candidatus Hydrogenedentota bacterium]